MNKGGSIIMLKEIVYKTIYDVFYELPVSVSEKQWLVYNCSKEEIVYNKPKGKCSKSFIDFANKHFCLAVYLYEDGGIVFVVTD